MAAIQYHVRRSIHRGGCNYGYLWKDEAFDYPQNGWDVAALADVHYEYVDSCGTCYEVKCDSAWTQDNYGELCCSAAGAHCCCNIRSPTLQVMLQHAVSCLTPCMRAGGKFDRTQVCYDSSASLVVRIVDTCRCTYATNLYSNKRW